MRRNAQPFERLRRRADFVATAKGSRSSSTALGVQARRRDADAGPPRFGITVTKKTAPRAVDRNRIRRRLREALRLVATLSGATGHDYVIVAREPLLTISFDELRTALAGNVAAATRRNQQRVDRKIMHGG